MISGLIRLRAADGDDDFAAVGELDVGPAQNRHLAAAQRPVEEQRYDHGVDEAAALSRLDALEATAGAARPVTGGEHGGALLGGEAACLAAAGGGVGGRGPAEVLEGLAGERPGRRLLTGVAGGAPHGGDGQRRSPTSGRSRCRCPSSGPASVRAIVGSVEAQSVGGRNRPVPAKPATEPAVKPPASNTAPYPGTYVASVPPRCHGKAQHRGVECGERGRSRDPCPGDQETGLPEGTVVARAFARRSSTESVDNPVEERPNRRRTTNVIRLIQRFAPSPG